jgi:hypothetical protein
MSELTLTIMRLGLLVALWVFVFAVVGVLRGDLYGTRVTARRADAGDGSSVAARAGRGRRAERRAAKDARRTAGQVAPAAGSAAARAVGAAGAGAAPGAAPGAAAGAAAGAAPGATPGGAAAGAVAASAGAAAGSAVGSRFGRGRREPRRLAVTAGPLAGTTLPLRPGGTLIGRAPECALVLDDDYASARHARIFHDGSTWVVEDLGSTNGTYLGQERLATPTPVTAGATLRIGQTVVELLR